MTDTVPHEGPHASPVAPAAPQRRVPDQRPAGTGHVARLPRFVGKA